MSNHNFYRSLPYIEDIQDISNFRLFKEVPPDWYVLVSDIRDSTNAVEEGAFKEVNFIATCAITSVINIEKRLELPFVFGGDGGTILIPKRIAEKAQDVLRDVRQFSLTHFGLDIRIACIPVIDIHRERFQIKVAKLKVADHYFQSVFIGGGLDHADYLAKNSDKYLIPDIPPKYRADFSGLRCVWQNLPSRSEEVVNILIKATSYEKDHSKIYEKVLNEIQAVYGPREERFPVKVKAIRYGMSMRKVHLETLLETYRTKKRFHRVFIRKFIENIIEFVRGVLDFRFHDTNLNAFRQTFIKSFDSEKFDDMLRMVISGTKEQRFRLVGFLEDLAQKHEIAYGVHTNESIYMTCVILERKNKQVHFVDGSNGGYTIAAKELKNRLKWQRMYM